MTMKKLARSIGIRFQQVQKYESGANRVSASRLVIIADAFGCDVVDLFGKHAGSKSSASMNDFIDVRVARSIVRRYCALSQENRILVSQFIKSLSR